MPTNSAAWLPASRTPLVVGPAPYNSPGAHEIVVQSGALAVNPLEWILQLVGSLIYPWLKYPFVLGSDVAGTVVEVGSAVTRFSVGDRVLAHAVGTDRDSNSSARGAFQHYVVVLEKLAARIPDAMPFSDAVVLPLGVSTAACALFQSDQLALRHPSLNPTPTGQTVLVWGGATSVGSNAIQLAVAAGYEVVATASPRSADYVLSLGASAVVDYASPTAVAQLIALLHGKDVAGAVAVATGSAAAVASVLRASTGRRFLSMVGAPAQWSAVAEKRSRLPLVMAGVAASVIAIGVRCAVWRIPNKAVFGSSLKNNEVSDAVYGSFLPAALEAGSYLAVPAAQIVGHGLEFVQPALEQQQRGVSARKLVVTLGDVA